MGLAGLRLVSVTPGSRLNAFFPYRETREVLREIRERVGDPASEPVLGVYTGRWNAPCPANRCGTSSRIIGRKGPRKPTRIDRWMLGGSTGRDTQRGGARRRGAVASRGGRSGERLAAARTVLRRIDEELVEVVAGAGDGD